jgi:hypothetical protein
MRFSMATELRLIPCGGGPSRHIGMPEMLFSANIRSLLLYLSRAVEMIGTDNRPCDLKIPVRVIRV